jgi:asparagine synthase (glutamine-hydrolysing)
LRSDEFILTCIKNKLTKAVKKRLLSDRPVGALLSGGLDSSLISGIICKIYKENNIKTPLKTFSIGLKGATDLGYAQIVADYIGSDHQTIECTEQDFLNAIPEVIYNIESYDTTTVRASVGNFLVAKYIKENTDIVVLFNGDGSDEQSGYYYLRNAPTNDEFHKECLKLLDEIKYYDVLRSDRCVSSKWSLEARTPFLDKEFVEFYMTIDPRKKMYDDTIIEKELLRKAFSNKNIIPDEVLWRPKEAFSDGCSSEKRSWHKIIQEHVDLIIPDIEFNYIKNTNKYKINPPMLKESYWYRKIFDSFYPNHAEIIPHYWLPNWTEEVDPSARELK